MLTAIRYQQFKVTFSAKMGERLGQPAAELRPTVHHQPADGPVRATNGRRARQFAEHKTWVLTPMIGIVEKHLATFREFPIRQLGLSADVGKTIEGVQSQILKLKQGEK